MQAWRWHTTQKNYGATVSTPAVKIALGQRKSVAELAVKGQQLAQPIKTTRRRIEAMLTMRRGWRNITLKFHTIKMAIKPRGTVAQLLPSFANFLC